MRNTAVKFSEDVVALTGTERILDLGCGDGTLTVQLSELVPDGVVVGVDATKGMIEAAEPKQKRNVRFLLMDINKLELGEEFDLIFSNATLHWVLDHRRLFKQMQGILVPGGRLRFNFAGDGNCSYFFKIVREAMRLPRFSALFQDFPWPWYMPSVQEYSALVKSTGFEEADVWGEKVEQTRRSHGILGSKPPPTRQTTRPPEDRHSWTPGSSSTSPTASMWCAIPRTRRSWRIWWSSCASRPARRWSTSRVVRASS